MTNQTETTERPISLNIEEVRSILDGRKTQKRIMVKGVNRTEKFCLNNEGHFCFRWKPDSNGLNGLIYRESPFGKAGDRLWVREGFHLGIGDRFAPSDAGENTPVWYAADKPAVGAFKCRQSNHMPRRASRITLEITDIRAERLQDISEEDAKSEGARGELDDSRNLPMWSHKKGFSRIWNSIYKNWQDNPWVWVVEFKVVT